MSRVCTVVQAEGPASHTCSDRESAVALAAGRHCCCTVAPGPKSDGTFPGLQRTDSAGNWRCVRCGSWQEMDQFSKRTASMNGLQSFCKKCSRDISSVWRQTLRGHVLDMVANACRRATKRPLCGSSLLNTDDVLDMLWLQGGRCYYSGIPLHCAAGPADWVWSIERLDNSVTYTRENCVLIAREFQKADQSRNKAKFPVFGTAQWSTSKAAHIWGPYVPGVGGDSEIHMS